MLPYSQFAPNKVLQKDGSQRVPHRVYGTLGDAYLQNLVINALIGWSLDADARDFNMDRLDGESASIGDVLSRCANLPFLSDRRVVLVQRAERLENMHRISEGKPGADDDDENDDNDENSARDNAIDNNRNLDPDALPGDISPDDSNANGINKKAGQVKPGLSPIKRLIEGMAGVPASTVLILSRTPLTPESNTRKKAIRCINAAIDKAIEVETVTKTRIKGEAKGEAKVETHIEPARGVIIDCTVGLKNGATATAILNSEAARRGIAMTDGAAQHLVNRAGNNIAGLLNEMDKCALRAGGDAISPSVIDEMVRRAPQETVFDLTDALGNRQSPRALAMLREMVEGGDAPEMILSLLVRHLRLLLQARSFLDARLPLDGTLASRMPPALASQLPRDNLATMLQSQSWMGSRMAAQARNFSTPQLQAALEAALKTDLATKGIEGDGGADSKKESELLLELFIAQLC